MRVLLLATFALLSAVRAEPVEARAQRAAPEVRPSTSSGRTAETSDQVARRYGLAGEVLVAKGDRILLDRGYGTIDPKGGAAHEAGERWRLASITKQVTAALVVKTRDGRLDLPWPQVLGSPSSDEPTIRQLLTHHSGLQNPDSSPAADGVPAFYTVDPLADPINSRYAAHRYCLANRGKPGGPFNYNNCDYLTVRTVIGFVGGGPDPWPQGMAMAVHDEIGIPGFVAGKPEPHFQLAAWGAAGGLMGTARAVFDFDRSLMTGRLLPPAGLAELWKPEGNGSYQALGQWVFPGQLKGCAKPKRIVQRDGEIYGVQARNFILPDDDLVVIVFTNRSSDDFAIGEVWQGKGFAYEALSAVECVK